MHRVVWFFPWQREIMERWLEGCAAGGWELEKFSGFRATFIARPPSAVRYRCDVNPPNRLGDGEKKLIYASAGWDYVCNWRDSMVFRTSDSAAVEIHTDVDLLMQTLTAAIKSKPADMIYELTITMLLVVPFLFNFSGGLSEFLLHTGMLHLMNLCFLLLYVGILIHKAAFLRRMKNGRGTGYFVHRARPFGLLLRVQKTCVAAAVAGGLVFFALGLFDGVCHIVSWSNAVPAGNLSVMRLTDVPGGVLSGLRYDDESSGYASSRSIFVPTQCELDEVFVVESGKGMCGEVRLISHRYRALTPGFAFLLSLSLSRQSYVVEDGLGLKGQLPYLRKGSSFFTHLWRYSKPDGSAHEIVAVKGRTVYRVAYFGNGDTDWLLNLLIEKSVKNGD